jgi:HK97 family phage prohead protease
METIKYKDLENRFDVKEIDTDALTITHYISTSTPDRYGEIMNPKGCDYSGYKKNPVVFFGHRSRDLPIAKNEKIVIDDSGILAVTKFDTSDFAKEIFRLNAEGFLNSWSIGFVPKKMKSKRLNVNDEEHDYLYIEDWELLEYSSVPIPANPDAVNLMLKEVKNEKVRDIILEINNLSTLHKDCRAGTKTQIEQIFTDKFKELKKDSEELIRNELKYFEDRLVKTLLRLKMK